MHVKGWNERYDPLDLNMILKASRAMKDLKLNRVGRRPFKDDINQNLETIAVYCQDLRSLALVGYVSETTIINNTAIKQIATNLRELEFIDLEGFQLKLDDALVTLAQNCVNLQGLHLNDILGNIRQIGIFSNIQRL